MGLDRSRLRSPPCGLEKTSRTSLQRQPAGVAADHTGEGRSAMTLPLPVVLDFKAFAKGTLRGFFDIELANGMIVRGCSLHKKRSFLDWLAR